ncbi:MAG: VWA domain-containing protein [Deltaproteobacteria bacterium]|nr:VWA domain-containing protein [Deltaproteobacteria bacterium]MBI3293288.1 VWA domain-containing protein [Deltaproteobacteria bacterium]
MPPELAASHGDTPEAGAWGDDWSQVRRLHRKALESSFQDPETDKKLVEAVLKRARQVIAHPTRPKKVEILPFEEFPQDEFELEQSFENDPTLNDSKEMVVEVESDKPTYCVAMLDSSSSMSGDKHLLASIAVAVMLLELPETSSLVTFASDANVIKGVDSNQTVEETVLKFLKVRPRGFTNIGRGLETGLRQKYRKRVGLLASDGRTTEGEDPFEIAKKFDSLIVLHLHGSGSDIESSRQIAQKGHGTCVEVERYEDLPRKMYDALRLLARMS